MPNIEILRGDLTQRPVDAIVNAANSTLLGGSGVDGAIHAKGGPAILEECRRIRAGQLRDGLPTGQAVATTAGDLPAQWVIHTVGPIYFAETEPANLLQSCHVESLRVADEIGARTVAFPAISCGAFGYPVEEAAPIAVRAVHESEARVEIVEFVLFDAAAHAAFRDAWERLQSR